MGPDGSALVVAVGDGTSAATVLRAWERWGESLAEHLDGAFAFALWDERKKALVLGRDRFGIKPLSYFPTPGGVVFASETAAVAAHPLVTPEIDATGIGAVLSQIRSPGTGVLRGMLEVPPGHTVTFTPRGRTVRRYWALRARPHELDRAATIARVRELLEDSIGREADGTDPAVLLSGGLDSSVLTGLVAASTGRAPRTFTVLFGDTAAAVPDRPYAEEVVRMWHCDHREITVRPGELLDPVTLAEVLAAKDQPTPFGDKNTTPYLFSGYVARHVPVVLSGEAADALFGGHDGAVEEGRVLTSFPWIERSRRFGMPYGIGTGLIDPALLRAVDIEGHLERTFREALDEVPHLPGDKPVDRLARQIDHLHMTRLLEQAVPHSERLGAAAGLDIRFPFADHRLYDLLYNVPAAEKSFEGREKSLLRAVGRDLVPASVLTRAKVPYPITYDPEYKAGLVRRLRDLLADGSAPVRPLVDLAGVRRVIDDPASLDRGGWLGRADAEMILQLDAWLRRLRVHVRL
ncbi:asparagine synthetase B [Streptomyces sp. AV19]|uniref:asparagine synthetase B family protein n=1 Tax=Streptomyces sp. AV19 TaxID=2793068 RepID=UPI0018FE6D2D|nr:asparagine synthetase B [Streptomyces sp. AV19]MBH1934823.1 asparagine synthetase B [Streptomyces sp. AV19]MDG4530572.1 asparagine synthetase B [Streptomyces sp. AV19]